MTRILSAFACMIFAAFMFADLATAQPPRGRQRESNATNEPGIPSGIVWYGKLSDGLAIARETQRPIFLLSAAPQCAGAPGMW